MWYGDSYSLVEHAMFALGKSKCFWGGGGQLCNSTCHFSVLKDICLHLKGPPLLCEEFSRGGHFSFISLLYKNFLSSFIWKCQVRIKSPHLRSSLSLPSQSPSNSSLQSFFFIWGLRHSNQGCRWLPPDLGTHACLEYDFTPHPHVPLWGFQHVQLCLCTSLFNERGSFSHCFLPLPPSCCQ